jgi:predicted Fe-S protein YdhL (DUF1289 family)
MAHDHHQQEGSSFNGGDGESKNRTATAPATTTTTTTISDDTTATTTATTAPVAVPVTPCTRICRYHSKVFDGQVCIGCYRETYEIGNWQRMKSVEKYYALLDAVGRFDETITSHDTKDTSNSIRDDLVRQAEYWKEKATTES